MKPIFHFKKTNKIILSKDHARDSGGLAAASPSD